MAHKGVVGGGARSSIDGDGKRALDLVRDALLRGDIGIDEAPDIVISLISVFEDVTACTSSAKSQLPLTRGDAAIFADAVERRWSTAGDRSSDMFSAGGGGGAAAALTSEVRGGIAEDKHRATLAAANLAIARCLAGTLS